LFGNLQHIGKITRTHGVKGEMIFMGEVDASLFDFLIFCFDSLPVPFFIDSCIKKTSSTYIIKLEGIDSPERALPFCGLETFLPEDCIIEEEEDELLENEMHPITGYSVIDTVLGSLGKVTELLDLPKNPLIVLLIEGHEVYIPWHDDIILEINDDAKSIRVTCPEGLLKINQ